MPRRARARRAGLDNITQDRDDLKNASEDFVRERDAHNSLRSELQLGQGRAQQEQQGRRKLEQQLPDIYYNDFPLGLRLLFAESVEEDVEVDFGRRGQARKSSAIICGRRRGRRGACKRDVSEPTHALIGAGGPHGIFFSCVGV